MILDDPFEQNEGTLRLFFAHEDGRNSASGRREVQQGGDYIEISYNGPPGNRTFTPIDWVESALPPQNVRINVNTSGSVAINFDAEEQQLYRIEISNDMETWRPHPNSPFNPANGPFQTAYPEDDDSVAIEFYRLSISP